METPGQITEQMQRIHKLANRLAVLSDGIAAGFEEVTEAAWWSGGNGGSVTPGGRGGGDADPTGQTAVSGSHVLLRSQVRNAARVLRRCEPHLDHAETILTRAFITALDPDTRQRIRHAEETQRAYERSRRGG